MNLKDYQKQCSETWIAGASDTRVILGLCGESGEVAELYKKFLRYDYGNNISQFENELKKELGDVFYYLVMICYEFGFDINEILEQNIKKLKSRKKRGKIRSKGNNR